MKRILLLALALLLLQGVCLAEIKKQVDDFDGSYCYYVDDTLFEDYGKKYINTTFNIFFDSKSVNGSLNLIVRFKHDSVYSMDSVINMKIDNMIYTWSTDPSTRANGKVELLFNLPTNVYEALMKTKKDISVRFNYNALDGHYRKDYFIPYKAIQEVQTMYKTYYKPPVTQVAK